jgi:hypothetical protein
LHGVFIASRVNSKPLADNDAMKALQRGFA